MDNLEKIADKLIRVIQNNIKKEPTDYDTTAVVKRIDGGTAWVHIDNGIDETPVAESINCNVGDKVRVRISNGSAFIIGNDSAPPTDDTNAIAAKVLAKLADNSATVAHEVADAADGKATDAKETAEAILIYDNTMELANGVATLTARVYQGGVDIHTSFEPEQFTWYLRNEENEQDEYLGSGYTVSVSLSDCGYGSEVVGIFTITDDAEALSVNNANYQTANNENITVRSTGDSVRVRDLTVTTSLYSTDKLMVVGAEDEHLATLQTLQDYLNLHLDKQVLFNTTTGWDSQTTLVSQPNTLYVYTDHQTDENNNNVAGIKVGDGNAYVVDLPFTDAVMMEHINDSTIHVTAEEKAFWNNKVSCYYAGTEQLFFTTQ